MQQLCIDENIIEDYIVFNPSFGLRSLTTAKYEANIHNGIVVEGRDSLYYVLTPKNEV